MPKKLNIEDIEKRINVGAIVSDEELEMLISYYNNLNLTLPTKVKKLYKNLV